jgi:DNA mismatch endonuclease (patch repair protein)
MKLASKGQINQRMAVIHSSNTKPKMNLRHALWDIGFRYRINDGRLLGSPDIVFPKYKTDIFHGLL